MTPWWVGVGAVETFVACGPNRHRLRWEQGALSAVDHSDPEGEAVLVGLGGDEPACLALVRHWRAHAADPAVLVLAARHPGDSVMVHPDDLTAARADLARSQEPSTTTSRSRAGRRVYRSGVEVAQSHVAMLELLALDPALQRRLQLEVAANLTDLVEAGPSGRDSSGSSTWAVLEAATVGRLTPVVRRWAGVSHPWIAVGAPAGVATAPGGWLTATVGLRWLTEVWGRYLATVGGFLVLEVGRVVDDRAEVTGLATPTGEPARLLLRGPAPWRVEQRLT